MQINGENGHFADDSVAFTHKIDQPPVIGFCLEPAKSGSKVKVAQRGFFTDYDGDFFFNCLDQISELYLSTWTQRGHLESEIRCCLISITKENEIFVNINFPIIMEILSKRTSKEGIKKGELITSEDVANIRRVQFPGISINPQNAIIYIFSNRWRRGLFFNFSPLHQENYQLNNLESLLASYHAYLMFPEIFRLYPTIKGKLINSGWFPFIRLLGGRYRFLANAVANDVLDSAHESKIVDSFDREIILAMLDAWMTKDLFREHEKVIRQGIMEYLEEDFISAIHILYPRIDGLMQHLHSQKYQVKAHSKELRDTLTQKVKDNGVSIWTFLPDEFNEYLKNFFFKQFDLPRGECSISRTSVAHGVVKAEELTKRNAFLSSALTR